MVTDRYDGGEPDLRSPCLNRTHRDPGKLVEGSASGPNLKFPFPRANFKLSRMKAIRKFSPPSAFLKPVARAVLGRVKTSYPRIQHLLVPLDFSGKSRQALRYAVPLAEKFSAKIHLVHVLPPVRKKDDEDLPALRAKATRRLESMASLLLPPNYQTENLVLSGNPARQILNAADTVGADLILITTHGATGLRRLLLGSTAEHVMRHAKCPVLSIRRQ